MVILSPVLVLYVYHLQSPSRVDEQLVSIFQIQLFMCDALL